MDKLLGIILNAAIHFHTLILVLPTHMQMVALYSVCQQLQDLIHIMETGFMIESIKEVEGQRKAEADWREDVHWSREDTKVILMSNFSRINNCRKSMCACACVHVISCPL